MGKLCIHRLNPTCTGSINRYIELYQCNITYPCSKFCGAGRYPSLTSGPSATISTVLYNLIILPPAKVHVSLYRIRQLSFMLTEEI